MKLKEVIPKFKYLRFLGEIDVRPKSHLDLKNLEVLGLAFDGILP